MGNKKGNVIRKGIDILTKPIRKAVFRIKLLLMDDWWYFTGASSYELFPPSFYYTHTQEEIERITKEKKEKIQEMIDKLP